MMKNMTPHEREFFAHVQQEHGTAIAIKALQGRRARCRRLQQKVGHCQVCGAPITRFDMLFSQSPQLCLDCRIEKEYGSKAERDAYVVKWSLQKQLAFTCSLAAIR